MRLPPYRAATLGSLLLLSHSLVLADIGIGELAARVKKARAALPSVKGELLVTRESGSTNLESSRPVVQTWSLEGPYRWWVQGEEWQLVKIVDQQLQSGDIRRRHHVIRSFQGKVLDYETIDAEGKESYPALGRLDSRPEHIKVSPLIGRIASLGKIEDLLLALQSPVVKRLAPEEGGQYAVEGNTSSPVGSQRTQFRIDPSKGYIVTHMLTVDSQLGLIIDEFEQVSGAWFPKVARYVGGGQTMLRLRFENFAVSQAPAQDEAPRLPPGTVIGSEENRLYRVKNDGSLQYWGQQGRRSRGSIAWGPVFVLSGAVILLSSLSWLFFKRKR